MATLVEQQELYTDGVMINKLEAALVNGASDALADSSAYPTASADTVVQANRERFAIEVLEHRRRWATGAWLLAIADNNLASPAQILSASDTTIQGVVDGLYDQMAAVFAVILTEV